MPVDSSHPNLPPGCTPDQAEQVVRPHLSLRRGYLERIESEPSEDPTDDRFEPREDIDFDN